MARLLKELLKNPHYTKRSFSTLTQQNYPSISTPQLLSKQSVSNLLNPSNSKAKEEENGVTHFSKMEIYPSFSFGYFLNPDLVSGSGLSQMVRPGVEVGAEMEHPGMMWADSVKKKRKKKMNKHKYKKLRKRLRRKTKT